MTPTEVFNVALGALTDICRWLGWKRKVSGGEAFRVLLRNGVSEPCSTVAHVFHCWRSRCSVPNSPAPLTQSWTEKKKLSRYVLFPGPVTREGRLKEKQKKTGSYQIHVYLLETKYSNCATSWKQRCGCKHPSSSLFWSALKRENAHDALVFVGFLISLPHRNRKQQMQPIVPVLFWCFVVWCHV